MKTHEKILLNPLFLSIVGFILGFCVIESALRIANKDSPWFVTDCIVVGIAYSMPGLVVLAGWAIARRIKFTWRIPSKTLTMCVVALVGQVAINLGAAIANGFNLNSVSPVEQYMFALACGGSEELLFRVTPIYILAAIGIAIHGKHPGYKSWKVWAWKIAGVAIGAAWFAAAHEWDPITFLETGKLVPGVYYNETAILAGLIAVGAWEGACMLVANDPTVNIFSHFVYDAMTNINKVI
jgi:uncharacterized membrane protein